jgi:hypothetical protein
MSEGLRGYRRTSPGPSWGETAFDESATGDEGPELLEQESFDVIYAHHYEACWWPDCAVAPVFVCPSSSIRTLLGSELGYYFTKFLRTPIAWLGAILDGRLIRLADAIPLRPTDHELLRGAGQPDLPTITAASGVEIEKFACVSAYET